MQSTKRHEIGAPRPVAVEMQARRKGSVIEVGKLEASCQQPFEVWSSPLSHAGPAGEEKPADLANHPQPIS